MTKVTYVPPDDGQHHPSSLTWNGVTFQANMPVDLDPVKHAYDIDEAERSVDPVTQRLLLKTVTRRVTMAEVAKTNPFFVVEGEPQAVARKPGRPARPKTSEDYRAHALAWIASIDDPDELAERWNTEETLRERCGVGEDDVSYLRPLFEARHLELKRQAA
jgi:hypothetical protein